MTAVHRIASGRSPAAARPFLRPRAPIKTEQRGGQTFISNKGYARYNRIADHSDQHGLRNPPSRRYMQTMPVITSLYASLFGILLVALSIEVIRLRRKHRVALQGLGNNKFVNRAVRIHGNFAEHVPLAIVLLLLMELVAAPAALLHGLGSTLLVSRLSHAAGLHRTSGPSLWRSVGVTLTLAVLMFEAGWLLIARR